MSHMNFLNFLLAFCYPIVISFTYPNTSLDNVSPSSGYVSLNVAISDELCFKPSLSQNQGSETEHNLITFPLSLEYITSHLHISPLENNIRYLFQDNKFMQFVKKINEDQYSSNLVYFSMLDGSINNQFDKENILTDTGKKIYDNGNNKEFILKCGNYLLSKYDIGMMLVYAIRIHFRRSSDKVNYESRLNQIRFGHFKNIFIEMRRYLYSLKIYDAIIELYVFQLGGELTNEHIKSAIAINNFLLSNCTIEHIEQCEIYIEELVEYYNTFSKQKEEKLNLVPLEHFTPISLIRESTLKLNEKYLLELLYGKLSYRADLLRRIDLVHKLLSSFNQIEIFYPLKIEQFSLLHQNLKNYYDELIKENSISNCYSDLFDIENCTQYLLNIGEFNMLYNNITEFSNYFNYEDVITLNLSNHFCLPNNMNWEPNRSIFIKSLNEDYYIDSNFGLQCSIEDSLVFICTDGIMNFTIKLTISDKTMISCINEYFGVRIEHYIEGHVEQKKNDYYITIEQ